MKKVSVFEHSVYKGNLAWEFYRFCARKQALLSKYRITALLYSVLYYLFLISKERYNEKRWSFLTEVKELEGNIELFWKTRTRRLSFTRLKGAVWVSEYPEIMLGELAKQHNAVLIANEYNIPGKHFNQFCSIGMLYKKSGENPGKYLWYKVLKVLYTALVLIVLGTGTGLVSLYFGSAYYIMPMFVSYFKEPYILFLNLYPVILLICALYFILNRVWLSFFLTSAITMLLTLINYFKILFRNDPLYVSDFSLFFESMDMAGKYNIKPDWKIYCVIFAVIFGTAAAGFLARSYINSKRFRSLGIILAVSAGIYSFNSIYLDNNLYKNTENNGLINKWSSTEVYISKGFIYPFIHSAKSGIENPPEGYKKKLAEEMLNTRKYSEIPDSRKVNIISIMLEAYNDFSKFEQIRFNKDVYGYLHQLQKESYSGELVTNVFAGNTINTERCFLTGFTSLFNIRGKVNSYVRYLGEQGYTVEGSHPGYNWFYNRENVKEYLGFQNYYFYENYYSRLANGKIAKDNVLFPQIIKLYEANKKSNKPYFSFSVTYQNHGPYPLTKTTDVKYIKNQGYPEAEYNILNNYFSGIYSTNQALKNVIDYFKKEKEPVVVIFFGDHNPWMGDNNSVYMKLGMNFDLGSETGFYNYYNTPYVIWGNDSAKKVLNNRLQGTGPKISPGFLMNEFFNLAGYEGNEFMKHSNELKEAVDVVHVKKVYKENGMWTKQLTDAAEQRLNKFLQIQYYWRDNFRDSY